MNLTITLPSEHRNKIAKALDLLNENTDPYFLNTTPSSGWIQVTLVDQEEIDPYLGLATLFTHKCLIQLSRILFSEMKKYLVPALWHEIGHCFGLDHVSEPQQIMSESVMPFSFYKEEQIQNFIQLLKQNYPPKTTFRKSISEERRCSLSIK